MDHLEKCLSLYLGCDTNRGRFMGIRKNTLFIQTGEELFEEYDTQNVGLTLFLYLRQIDDLTDEQRKQLIKEGLVIGRPYGYTFSNHGFLYLLTLSVDLFGLINAGFARDIKTIEGKIIDL